MKKRAIFLILFSLVFLILILVSIASAAYVCSNNTEISKDSKEIAEKERKSVNSLGIAVINAGEHGVLKKIEAELILEAEKIFLTNETRKEKVEFSDGAYTIEMINTTGTSAKIKIDGSQEEIEEGENKKIGSLEVILNEAEESSGGSVKIIVGNKKISLSSDENPTETLTINSVNYLIEIFSATDMSAIITVWKCKNSEVLSLEEQKQEPEENINQISQTNRTEEAINQTSDIPIKNKTKEPEKVAIEKSIFNKIWFWFSLAIIVIMIGYIIYKKTI